MLYPHPQIYHALKAIFVHVPKAAGTSIERHLRDHCPPGSMPKCGGHSTALGFRHGFPTEFATYFKFAVVREPVDRFISAFYYLLNQPVHPALSNYAIHAARGAHSLEKFVSSLQADASIAPKIVHLAPQWQFICDHAGKILVDEVYRFESIETAWQDICQRLNLPAWPLAKLNQSKRPTEPASVVVTEYVRATYARDYELFGYGAETVQKSAVMVSEVRGVESISNSIRTSDVSP